MTEFSKLDIQKARNDLARWYKNQTPNWLISKNLELLKDDLAVDPSAPITNLLYKIRANFTELSLAQHVIKKDVKSLVQNLSIAGRFGYMLRVVGGEKYAVSDCIHVFDLFKMLAANDMVCVNKTIDKIQPPFKQGHPDTRMLCAGVYTVLGKHDNPELIIEKLSKDSSSKFFTAMQQCLLAIINKDEQAFYDQLTIICKSNRQQQFHISMEKLVCIEAHAMVKLWELTHYKMTQKLSALPISWLQELYDYNHKNTTMELLDFDNESKVLNQWMHELPEEFDPQLLKNELKETFIKHFTRRFKNSRRRSKLQQNTFKKLG
ncbi:hypothetical protein [Marinicellulosiphila megalodicopiae]|uniref:hypothetical protein n=1 Tax=Marinicellulosiphila megalodicopiae TaxID=2724896 RepID=UPI003BB186AF